MPIQLIADSGATKCEWCLVDNEIDKTVFTTGISPYFLAEKQIVELLRTNLLPELSDVSIDELHFYGTGLGNPKNVTTIVNSLKMVFPAVDIEANTDLLAAARALCGNEKGIACILGTGSNSCYYDGKEVSKNIASLGYVLGDEGSGAHLGKKVIQYYLYNTFDEDLRSRFDAMFVTSYLEILENVYQKPFPNRYLASFAAFLAENRGHYMIENILEDGLNDFFFNHLNKYGESWTSPINFVGSVAFGFKDVLQELCNSYQLELGKVLKAPMEGLVKFHANATSLS
ncbi:N-acetylglucosamine kinase [Segetibacter sp.]|jgi:glucosamine kinase|uniref:N-acetylglucosamine kinase n=1 Tax=Segetibacter sp. TaxID=2231182 RepID=UPI00261CF9A9|nr:N-acetylglucosamine kinase [Segetibacter sp.]MCW3081008.1 N-acetylglucosamine kinase [Segetibacter sp.]